MTIRTAECVAHKNKNLRGAEVDGDVDAADTRWLLGAVHIELLQSRMAKHKLRKCCTQWAGCRAEEMRVIIFGRRGSVQSEVQSRSCLSVWQVMLVRCGQMLQKLWASCRV